jgi:hypothetical protein
VVAVADLLALTLAATDCVFPLVLALPEAVVTDPVPPEPDTDKAPPNPSSVSPSAHDAARSAPAMRRAEA